MSKKSEVINRKVVLLKFDFKTGLTKQEFDQCYLFKDKFHVRVPDQSGREHRHYCHEDEDFQVYDSHAFVINPSKKVEKLATKAILEAKEKSLIDAENHLSNILLNNKNSQYTIRDLKKRLL